MRYNWPMSTHASQAFSIAHCTDSEDLPLQVAETCEFQQNVARHVWVIDEGSTHFPAHVFLGVDGRTKLGQISRGRRQIIDVFRVCFTFQMLLCFKTRATKRGQISDFLTPINLWKRGGRNISLGTNFWYTLDGGRLAFWEISLERSGIKSQLQYFIIIIILYIKAFADYAHGGLKSYIYAFSKIRVLEILTSHQTTTAKK